MKKTTLLIIFLVPTFIVHSQNLISNPSFEEVNTVPSNWSGTFSKFHRWMKTWSTPTQGTPDILHITKRDKMVPKRPKVDLTKHTPRTGKIMMGIKTYGCASMTLHCKEYLQIALKEPLQKGEQYYIEYWVSPIETSVKVNSFGLALSTEKIQELFVVGLLDIYPVVFSEEIIGGDSIEWHRISGVFEADENYKYAIIGNFGDDKYIKYKTEKDGLDYGYYLVDDVLLKPLFEKAPPKFSPNETIVLQHILFEFDKANIEESSNTQLDELVAYLKLNEKFKLKIMGHTDSKGGEKHNLELSQRRAEAIKNYLVEKGIGAERIESVGFGSQYPIVENDTEQNRQLNRRVEIKMVEQ